jgi:cytochrome c553
MFRYVNTITGVVALLSVFISSAVSADEPAALATCVACHSKAGVAADPSWPNLGGQHEAYLAIQLKAFRSGERKNALMSPMAANLSDSDIAELAVWFAAQQVITAASGDDALVEEGRNRAGYCHACHGMQGHPVANEWPIIAGQNADYVSSQLMAFQQGQRHHPLMANIVRDLSADAMAALGAYYSQVTKRD